MSAEIKGLSSLNPTHWQSLTETFPELDETVEKISQSKEVAQNLLKEVNLSLSELDEANNRIRSKFTEKQSEFLEEHSKALEQQAHMKTMLQEAESLEDEKRQLLDADRHNSDRLERLTTAPQDLADARTRLDQKIQELHGLMTNAAQQVEAMSEGALSASAHWEQLPSDFFNSLMEICDKNRIREVSSKCEDRAKSFTMAGEDCWSRFCDSLLDLLRSRVRNGYSNHVTSDYVKQSIKDNLIGELTSSQYDTVYSSLDEDTVASALTATRKSLIYFEYSDNGNFIPFEAASPGQQSSAILKLLLNQEAGTLIIDQPEDDLDNRVIIDIANQLQTTKRKRQLIFSTHNPNFVVNGDADKVVALKSNSSSTAGIDGLPGPRIDIDTDGAIETKAVRYAITETMEGGQDAFELRSRKYRF